MANIKVGDRVKVVGTDSYHGNRCYGRNGVVTNDDGSSYRFHVEFEDGGFDWLREDDLAPNRNQEASVDIAEKQATITITVQGDKTSLTYNPKEISGKELGALLKGLAEAEGG